LQSIPTALGGAASPVIQRQETAPARNSEQRAPSNLLPSRSNTFPVQSNSQPVQPATTLGRAAELAHALPPTEPVSGYTSEVSAIVTADFQLEAIDSLINNLQAQLEDIDYQQQVPVPTTTQHVEASQQVGLPSPNGTSYSTHSQNGPSAPPRQYPAPHERGSGRIASMLSEVPSLTMGSEMTSPAHTMTAPAEGSSIESMDQS
jgi:hypothetical protein